MTQALLRRGLTAAAIAAAAVLASCSTPPPEAPPPEPPPPPPPVTLNEGVAQSASIYVAFVRDVSTIQAGGFSDAEAIQAAIRRGAAYQPAQLSRGMIAYGAILALQSPEYVAGVRTFAADPTQRQEMIARIVADPAYAATLPGAEAAASLIGETIGKDSAALQAIGTAIENDAYKIQERNDPRRRWAVTPVTDRVGRLESAKTQSVAEMLPSAEESARLFAASHAGTGLDLGAADASQRRGPPYTPAVVNSLAIAALAALGAAGDDARPNTEALVTDANSEFCLNMSKLMLFQCLAAARPSYEDMFCAGRHIMGDLATCTAQNLAPPPSIVIPATAVADSTPMAADANSSASNAVQTSVNR